MIAFRLEHAELVISFVFTETKLQAGGTAAPRFPST